MKKEENSKGFLKTTIFTDYGEFFVSTIYRRSSAALNPDGWYFETFGWSLDENGRNNHIIADNSGALSEDGAIRQHAEVLEQLAKTGKFEEKEL